MGREAEQGGLSGREDWTEWEVTWGNATQEGRGSACSPAQALPQPGLLSRDVWLRAPAKRDQRGHSFEQTVGGSKANTKVSTARGSQGMSAEGTGGEKDDMLWQEVDVQDKRNVERLHGS